VTLEGAEKELQGDELIFDPQNKRGVLISYDESVEIKSIGEEESEIPLSKNINLEEITLSKIRRSFIYFTGHSFDISAEYEILGYDVTIHIEGVESIGFKKLNLTRGPKLGISGFSIDKIWFNRRQGIIGRASFFYEDKDKINSLTQVNYEERSVLKDYFGPARQADFMTSNTIKLDESLNLGITGNYSTSNLWNARALLTKNWNSNLSTQVELSYNKPINLRGETWLGLAAAYNAGKFGNISFSGRYEFQNQMLANMSYGNTLFKRLNLRLFSSYSQIKWGGSEDFSKIMTGGVNLSYTTKIFNLSTDYYLNYDLMGSQLLSQPQLRFGINPIRFYRGLLSATIYNVFIYNQLKFDELSKDSYSNNTVFNLSTQPLFIQKSLSLNFNLAVEQMFEKEGRNFTSAGLIINAKKDIFRGISFEAYYSMQSRRKTEGWFVEGTTGQDMSMILRVNPRESLNGWVSFSYDPKNNEWTQSFMDLSVGFLKKWRFHSLFNYDFLLNKINNVDLYLVREAGRFQIRFVWRSLSKQFLVELTPR
jgi:hypothetical protein